MRASWGNVLANATALAEPADAVTARSSAPGHNQGSLTEAPIGNAEKVDPYV
jgi:hypothetical protein